MIDTIAAIGSSCHFWLVLREIQTAVAIWSLVGCCSKMLRQSLLSLSMPLWFVARKKVPPAYRRTENTQRKWKKGSPPTRKLKISAKITKDYARYERRFARFLLPVYRPGPGPCLALASTLAGPGRKSASHCVVYFILGHTTG